jgi:hypothetical protein
VFCRSAAGPLPIKSRWRDGLGGGTTGGGLALMNLTHQHPIAFQKGGEMILKTHALVLLICCICLPFGGCAGPSSTAMVPSLDDIGTARHDKTVNIALVEGGRSPQFGGMETLTDETFKEALLASFNKAKLFKTVGSGIAGDVDFYAEITSQDTITNQSLTYTIHLVVNYRLAASAGGNELYQKLIRTKCAVTASEALSGATRMTKALECATRKSIRALLRDLAALDNL